LIEGVNYFLKQLEDSSEPEISIDYTREIGAEEELQVEKKSSESAEVEDPIEQVKELSPVN